MAPDDMTLQDLHQERVRVKEELRAIQAQHDALMVELGELDFRINYFSGVPREARSGWSNPVLTEKPRKERRTVAVPDFDLLTD